jgi:formate dehydrogenase subunit gamma
MSYPPGTLIRNTTAARINHWITAACFVLLMLSGLAMFHPLLFFLSALFGSGQWARAIHPWIGCVLLVSYAGLIVQFWRDNLWNGDDIAWMRAFGRVLRNEEEGVPELGRFNAGQKFVFCRWRCSCPCSSSQGF